MMTKDRIIPEREPGPWPPGAMAREQYVHRPGKIILALLLVIIGVVTAFTLIYMDLRRDMQASNDPTSASTPGTMVEFDQSLPSVHTIAEDLTKNGFEVEVLHDFTDQQGFAYEASETKIDGVGAYILAFDGEETTNAWADALHGLNGIGVVGKNWGISLESEKDDQKSKALAEKIANKIGGQARWRPEGE